MLGRMLEMKCVKFKKLLRFGLRSTTNRFFSIKYQNKNRTKLCDKRANEKEYEISCRFDFIFGIDKETFQAVL